eukprot:Hpha_TRINITY_DN2509_c1_g1::TRINITY_DN2509_c1_g1_i1::g.1413::m.1413
MLKRCLATLRAKPKKANSNKSYWKERAEFEVEGGGKNLAPEHPAKPFLEARGQLEGKGRRPAKAFLGEGLRKEVFLDAGQNVKRDTRLREGKDYFDEMANIAKERDRERYEDMDMTAAGRSDVSQAVVDWQEKTSRMPLGEMEISDRKHSVCTHLMRIRENPIYRWKHERFVVRNADAVRDLATRKYLPEVVLLESGAPVPQALDPDRTSIVYCDHQVLRHVAGAPDAWCVAEYFIPDEEPKNMMWLPEGTEILRRVAVLQGVRDGEQLGRMLRSAVAFGFDAILISECADPYSQECIDSSLAAHVSLGGYPRVHILREEDGDDVWGILNRVIARHDLLPIAISPAAQGAPEDVWGMLHERGDIERGLCVFFGPDRGADLAYVAHNVDRDVAEVSVEPAGIGTPLLEAPQRAAIAMHALREPTFTQEALVQSTLDAGVGDPVPVTVPAGPAGRMRVDRSFHSVQARAAYKSVVSYSSYGLTVEQKARQNMEG